MLESSRPELEASLAAVLVVDANGVIVFVDRKLERIFGYSTDELVGQPVDILVPDAQRPEHAAHRTAFAQAGSPHVMGYGRELQGRRKDGTLVPIEVRLTPMALRDDVLILASVVDVSAHLRIEETRRAALEDGLAFERMLAQFSVRCINLPESEVPAAIRAQLGKLGEWL